MKTLKEMLDATDRDRALRAEEAEDLSGVDRREFLFMSMVAAAASTFGGHPLLGQSPTSAAALGAPSQQQQAQVPPIPLGNGEPPAEQFMPYPGGTGALMEKMVKQHGAKAFQRSTFTVPKWTGAVPTSDEAIAFLPAHQLASLIKSRKPTVYAGRPYVHNRHRTV